MPRPSLPASTSPPLSFGAALRRLRRQRDLTQEQLAERAGLSARTVSDLERGTPHQPRGDTLRLLGAALGLDHDAQAAFAALIRPLPEALTGVRSLPEPALTYGRERELATILTLLTEPGVRLVTLTGVAGIGKSHLARAAANRLAVTTPGAVCYLDLAAPTTSSRLPTAILAAFGIDREPGASRLETLAGRLAGTAALIVIDHAAGARTAADCHDLMQALPLCRLLVTRRTPLGLPAEHTLPIGPLVAAPGGVPLDDAGDADPAARLFLSHARRAAAGRAPIPDELPLVREIAAGLLGNPGAIIGAASLLRTRSLRELHQELTTPVNIVAPVSVAVADSDLLAPLRQASRDAYAQRRSGERLLFRQLAAFAGPFSRRDAQLVVDLAGMGGASAWTALDQLVVAGLVQLDHDAATERNLSLAPPVRAVASALLAQSGDEGTARRRHTQWLLGVIEHSSPEPVGPGQDAWFARLEALAAEWRLALTWALTNGEALVAARIVRALYRYWTRTGALAEADQWIGRALAANPDPAAPATADLHLGAGVISFQRGDYQSATNHWLVAGRTTEAGATSACAAFALGYRGLLAGFVAGDRQAALERFVPARQRLGRLGEPVAANYMARNIGMIACHEHEASQAERVFRESLMLAGTAGDADGVAMTFGDLGFLRLREGKIPAAADLLTKALQVSDARQNVPWLLWMLELRGMTAAAGDGREWLAATLFAAAARARQRIGAPTLPSEAALIAPYLQATQARLGAAEFGHAWWEGSQLSAADACALAISG